MSRATRRKARRAASDYMSPAEAARVWPVSESTVRRMCAAGMIPGARNVGLKTLPRWLVPKTAFPRGGTCVTTAGEYAEIGVG